MTAFIYNVDSMEIVCVIEGEDNIDCENKADDLGYMGCDEYGLTYNDNF